MQGRMEAPIGESMSSIRGRQGGRLQNHVHALRTPEWTWPFAPHQTPAAVGPDWDGSPYRGQATGSVIRSIPRV